MFRALISFFFVLLSLSFVEGGEVQWFTNYQQALDASKQSSKKIFLDCFADWCYWCHQLDKDVYNTPRFLQFLESYIPLRINVEDNAEGTQLAEKLKITGLPTMFILDENGKVLNRIGGYMETDPLIQDIQKIQSLMSRDQKSPPDFAATMDLANEYLARDMHEEAEIRYQKILASDLSSPHHKETAQFSLALSQYYQRNLQDALVSLETYRRDFSEGSSNEDALLLLSEIYLEMDSNDKARASLQEFLQKYPESGNVHRAKEVLSLLDVQSN